MYCKKCRSYIQDDFEFCPNCGEKIISQTQDVQPVYPPPTPQPESKTKDKKAAIIILVLIAAIVVAGAVLAIVFLTGTQKYEFKNYIADNIDFAGTNGTGYVASDKRAIVDYESMFEDLTDDDVSFVSEDDYNVAYSLFDSAIDVSIPDNTDYKNGDKVNIKIRVDYDKINDYSGFKNKLTGDEKITIPYIVSGLGESESINPFGVIKSVKYTVSSGKTKIYYDKSYSEKFGKFTAEYKKGDSPMLQISNEDGDVIEQITFSASFDEESSDNTAVVTAHIKNEELDKDNGFVITPTTKEYTAKVVKPTTTTTTTTTSYDNKTDFVTDANQINYNDYLILKERCLDERSKKYPDATFARSYFVFNNTYYSKKQSDSHKLNGLNFVFECTDSNGNIVYTTCCAFNIMVDEYGNIVNVNSTELTLGKSKYNSFDEYVNKVKPGNWDIMEVYEY